MYTNFLQSTIVNHPTFHSDERLVNLERGRECFVSLSILFVYGSQAVWRLYCTVGRCMTVTWWGEMISWVRWSSSSPAPEWTGRGKTLHSVKHNDLHQHYTTVYLIVTILTCSIAWKGIIPPLHLCLNFVMQSKCKIKILDVKCAKNKYIYSRYIFYILIPCLNIFLFVLLFVYLLDTTYCISEITLIFKS